MTVAELLDRMTSAEWVEWYAHDLLGSEEAEFSRLEAELRQAQS